MKLRYTIAFSLPMLSTCAIAADMSVRMEIPQLNVAAYHRPYIAVWLEHPDQSFAANLSVLYDVKKKDNAGTKWLKDMRQWWRKSGRELEMPVDGVSGATRAPGETTISYAGARALQNLPAGEYHLVVEASREAGGRDLVRVPFQWPPKKVQTLSAKGKEELGNVALQLKP